jgi:hypothetical protein
VGDDDEELDRETALARQKTPHPKELKAKAHKLFGNKKGEQMNLEGNIDGSSVTFYHVQGFCRNNYELRVGYNLITNGQSSF